MTTALSPSHMRQLHRLPQLRRSLLLRPSESTPWRSMLCCHLRAFPPAMATVPMPKKQTLRALFSHGRPANGVAAPNSGNAGGRGRSSSSSVSSTSSGSSSSSTSSNRSSSGGSSSRSSDVLGEDIFSANGFVRTVEVCTGSAGPWEHLPGGEARATDLLRQGVFHAVVFPDLPAIASLRELFSSQWPFAPTAGAARQRKKKGKETQEHGEGTGGSKSIAAWSGSSSSSTTTNTTTTTASSTGNGNGTEMPVDPSGSAMTTSGPVSQGVHAWEVRTVAAQTRTLQQLQRLMVERGRLACGNRGIAVAAAGADVEYNGEGYEGGRGALLLLSGGHPLRSVPLVGSLMPCDSVKMIRAARDMRDRLHLLPRGLQIWGVENPNCNNLDRLKRKVDAGAEAVLLQPPLLPDTFATWWMRAHDAGLTSAVRLVIGVPVISSSRNLAFWNFLAGVDGSGAEAAAEADLFKRGESEHAENAAAFGTFRRAWTSRYIRMAEDLPGAAGIHIMPVSKRGWKDLSNMIVDTDLKS